MHKHDSNMAMTYHEKQKKNKEQKHGSKAFFLFIPFLFCLLGQGGINEQKEQIGGTAKSKVEGIKTNLPCR